MFTVRDAKRTGRAAVALAAMAMLGATHLPQVSADATYKSLEEALPVVTKRAGFPVLIPGVKKVGLQFLYVKVLWLPPATHTVIADPPDEYYRGDRKLVSIRYKEPDGKLLTVVEAKSIPRLNSNKNLWPVIGAGFGLGKMKMHSLLHFGTKESTDYVIIAESESLPETKAIAESLQLAPSQPAQPTLSSKSESGS